MEFEELLQYARTYDKKAMMDIIEMYVSAWEKTVWTMLYNR